MPLPILVLQKLSGGSRFEHIHIHTTKDSTMPK